ncbi:MAG: hypothetical protein MUP45_01820, partial [Candidatus Marinimicrobia bacterium]|nr:hypothetical protein [Candidatus Neomarinimicrobiota bacterium]
MKKVVVDTNILIDYANGYARWVNDILNTTASEKKLVLPTIVIAEYFTSKDFDDEKKIFVADKTFALFEK